MLHVRIDHQDRDIWIDEGNLLDPLRAAIKQHQMIGLAHRGRELVHNPAWHARELMLGLLAKQRLGGKIHHRPGHRLEKGCSGNFKRSATRESAAYRNTGIYNGIKATSSNTAFQAS